MSETLQMSDYDRLEKYIGKVEEDLKSEIHQMRRENSQFRDKLPEIIRMAVYQRGGDGKGYNKTPNDQWWGIGIIGILIVAIFTIQNNQIASMNSDVKTVEQDNRQFLSDKIQDSDKDYRELKKGNVETQVRRIDQIESEKNEIQKSLATLITEVQKNTTVINDLADDKFGNDDWNTKYDEIIIPRFEYLKSLIEERTSDRIARTEVYRIIDRLEKADVDIVERMKTTEAEQRRRSTAAKWTE